MSMSISLQKSPRRTNIKHNNREMTEKEKLKNTHIDYSMTNTNGYVKRDLKKLYEEEFGEALQKYNDKQKRADRKIKNYHEHIKRSKKTFVQQEIIIQVGDKDDFVSDEDRLFARKVLIEWMNGFEGRNPQMPVYNIALHNDEASPHLHVNFVPIAYGYKRGLEKQVSFDKAMLQQNPNLNKDRPFEEWRAGEVAILEEILAERGIARKKVGKNNYKDVNEYKEKMDLQKEIDELRKTKDTEQEQFDVVQARCEEVSLELDQLKAAKGKVASEYQELIVGYEDFEKDLEDMKKQAEQNAQDVIAQIQNGIKEEEERLRKESEKRLSETQLRVERIEQMEKQKLYILNGTLENVQEFWRNHNNSVKETEFVKEHTESANEYHGGKKFEFVKMPLIAYKKLLDKAEGYNNAFLELDRVSSENRKMKRSNETLKDENESFKVKYSEAVDYNTNMRNHIEEIDTEYNYMRNFITEKILVREYSGYRQSMLEKVAKEQRNRQNTSPIANKKKSISKDNGLEL